MVKRFLILIVLSSFVSSGLLQAQYPRKTTVVSGGYNREYLLYVPESGEGRKPEGLLVCLHGFNRTMEDFFSRYPIASVADLLNVVVLAPQALPEQDAQVVAVGETLAAAGIPIALDAVWSCGLRVTARAFGFLDLLDVELNAGVDDVSFIEQIIRTTSEAYMLAPESCFLFGTSMGAFMSYQYALLSEDRPAGMVLMHGSMGRSVRYSQASEGLQVPVCDFHSVDDEVVPYAGSSVISFGGFASVEVLLCRSKQDVLRFWVERNGASASPEVENVGYYPSVNAATATKYIYSNSDGSNEVVHYQIRQAHHAYYFRRVNGDCMDYDEEVARFLKAHMRQSGAGLPVVVGKELRVYPNPTDGRCTVYGASGAERVVRLYTITGAPAGVIDVRDGAGVIDLSGYAQGIYLLRYGGKTVKIAKK